MGTETQVKNTLHIYAKHQYRQESEYESMWCIIHSNIWVQLQSYHKMWHNITRILYHWQAQIWEYKEIYNYELYKRCSRVTKRKLERRAGGPGRIRLWTVNCWSMTLPLRNSDHQEVHHGLNSKIWTWRFGGVSSPQWVVWWMSSGVHR